MGQHRDNPIAQLHAGPRQTEWLPGYALEPMVIPNEETAARIALLMEEEVTAGRDPRLLKVDVTEDEKDFAIVIKLSIAKGSALVPPDRLPRANWNGPIIFRCPLKDMIARYEGAMSAEREKLG